MEAIVKGVAYVSQASINRGCTDCAGRDEPHGEGICGKLPDCTGVVFVRKLDAVSTSGPMVQSDPAPPALARATDPATSKRAAAGMVRKAGKIADLILVELSTGNYTGHELSEQTGVPLNSITPRFAQLSRKGLIHAHSGKGRETVWALGNGVEI